MNQKYFATAARGLETVTAQELEALGAKQVKPSFGGVEFEGDLRTLYKANLWLRTASRVLVPMRQFSARTLVMLYDQVHRMKWEHYLNPQKTFAIDCSIASRSEVERGMHNPQFLALKIKDAMVDRLREKYGERPNVDPKNPDVRINAYFQQGKCTLSLDASGGSLHERGYRLNLAHAPLKETLAAGMVLLTGWKGDVPFLDPMCGSGTLLLEAAMIAMNRAPGLKRQRFGFEGFPDFDASLWKSVREEAIAAQIERPKAPIVGFDVSRDAVASAIENAKRLGLEKVVHFEKRDLQQLQPIGKEGMGGVMIANPPYGERLGEVENLKPTYKMIGDLMKQRLKGWTGFIFTGSSELSKCVGLKASRRIELFNGPIECRLLKYDLY